MAHNREGLFVGPFTDKLGYDSYLGTILRMVPHLSTRGATLWSPSGPACGRTTGGCYLALGYRESEDTSVISIGGWDSPVDGKLLFPEEYWNMLLPNSDIPMPVVTRPCIFYPYDGDEEGEDDDGCY
jgi:hypothetical protein